MQNKRAVILGIFLGTFLLFGVVSTVVTPTKIYRSVPKTILDGCVKVETSDGTGSGVIVEYRKVLTAAHVVINRWGEVCDRINVVFRITDRHVKVSMPAKVIKIDRFNDLALLELDHTFGNAVKVARTDVLNIGDPLFIVGSPMGVSKDTTTFGYLADKFANNRGFFQSGNTCFFGNSGGGVFDANRGELVGILVEGRGAYGVGMAPNVAIFVPVGIINKFLSK